MRLEAPELRSKAEEGCEIAVQYREDVAPTDHDRTRTLVLLVVTLTVASDGKSRHISSSRSRCRRRSSSSTTTTAAATTAMLLLLLLLLRLLSLLLLLLLLFYCYCVVYCCLSFFPRDTARTEVKTAEVLAFSAEEIYPQSARERIFNIAVILFGRLGSCRDLSPKL